METAGSTNKMILNKTPVTMAEVYLIVKETEEKSAVKDYLKRFTKLTKEKAELLLGEIRALNNLKLKEEDMIKIVDFLPSEAEELNVIMRESTLSEEETNAILEIVKKY